MAEDPKTDPNPEEKPKEITFEIDVSTKILDSSGKPMEKAKDEPLTIRDMLLSLVANPYGLKPREQFVAGELDLQIGDESVSVVKLSKRRFDLLQRIVEQNKSYDERGGPIPRIIVARVYNQIVRALGLKEEDLENN